MNRRQFVKNAMLGLAGFCTYSPVRHTFASQRSIQKPSSQHILDKTLNIEIPKGCKARIVARSSHTVIPSSQYHWHAAPDGGACFVSDNFTGGWIYVSNSEMGQHNGGVGALHFDAEGNIRQAYPILSKTSYNCAGGKTPWGTWLSCEENKDLGQVYECDPSGQKNASIRPALGSFNHEAVAVDPNTSILYLTEDVIDSAFYRFIPDSPGHLTQGKLQVAIENESVSWQTITDPSAKKTPTRYQVEQAKRFKGAEGIIYDRGKVYFTTKFDNRVWSYSIEQQQFSIIYDQATSNNPILSGVDNIEVTPSGELLIAEDGGDMQIVGIGHDGTPFPLVTIYGQDQSEICGPAFSPDGTRLYFSSQRGTTGNSEDGITYELQFT